MKKIGIFLAAILLLTVTAAQAQEFYYGPKVGLNVSGLTKTSYASARLRANFGLHAGYTVSDLIGVQVEALYSMQGNKFSNNDHIISTNYIKIPVLAKLYLVGGLNVEAGISFNWLVRAQEKYTDDQGRKVTRNIGADTKGFDFTIPVGINYRFAKFVDLGLRYDISMVRVPEDKKNKAKSSNWSINLGIRF